MTIKTIFKIAKLELSTLFYSPVAWLVLVIFTFQSGLSFTEIITRWEKMFAMGWAPPGFTMNIFSDTSRGFFASVQGNLYLYIPLLTMGLISREISSGSIKLLLSSPIKISEIVLGKYVAMLIYGLLLILALVPFIITGAYAIPYMDWGLVISGLIGLYLLICAYAAIGLFMSSLTSYQVVAALCTLVMLAALNFIGTVWQDIAFVRDITYFLSIAGRSSKFISGLISSKDIIYFIIIVVSFIGLTIMKLNGGRETISLMLKTSRYALFISVMLMFGYISSRPLVSLYYDMTATESRTLTKNTQQILKQLTKPLKVTTYANLFDNFFPNFTPKRFNVELDRAEQYTRFLPGMQFDYVFYYDTTFSDPYLFQSEPTLTKKQLAKKVAKTYDMKVSQFLSPEEIRKVIDLMPEENRTVRLYEYDGKRAFTRMFMDNLQHPSEQEITAVLKGFLTPQPIIAFANGNNERDIKRSGDKDYQFVTARLDFRYALINQGFKVIDVFLDQQDIPGNIAALVIADPKAAYNEVAVKRIQSYIDAGGNMLFAGEPGRQAILNPLLKPLGVQLTDGVLIEESKDFAPDFVLAKYAATAGNYSNDWKDTGAVLSLSGAAALQFEKSGPFHIEPVIVTNKNDTWNKLGMVNLDSAKVVYDPALGDKKESLPTGVALTRKIAGKEQRIMVFGDADFICKSELMRDNIRTSNFNLTVGMFKWFSNGAFPIDTSRPELKDDKLRITSDGVDTLKMIFLGLIPGLVIIAGAVILIRRKRN